MSKEVETSCCLRCHFEYEEEYAFPFLSDFGRELLQGEHDDLRVQNYPHAKVMAHADREMLVFKQRCPPWVIARIEADHEKFGGSHG